MIVVTGAPPTACEWDTDTDGFRVCVARRNLRIAAATARAEGQMAAYRVFRRRLFEHHCTPMPPAGEGEPNPRASGERSQRPEPVGAVTREDITKAIRKYGEAARRSNGGPCDSLYDMREAERWLRRMIERYARQDTRERFRQRLEGRDG